MDVDTGRLSELKYNFVCHFRLVGGSIREFVCDANGPTFLKRELIRFGVNRFWYIRVHNHTTRPVRIHTF